MEKKQMKEFMTVSPFPLIYPSIPSAEMSVRGQRKEHIIGDHCTYNLRISDVFPVGPEMLRRLRERFYNQVSPLKRGRLRDALCG